ncbi:MAG: hypothetical protein AAB689_02145, partial [Patescibacteria group bacterium]
MNKETDMNRNFRSLLEARWAEGKFDCLGLDSEFCKIPESERRSGVEATKDLVCAYKPNLAFYIAHGEEGIVV